MAKHTYVIELDTADLNDVQFEKMKGNLLSRIVTDTSADSGGSCGVEFDKHTKVRLFCGEETNPFLDLKVEPVTLDISNPMEIEEIKNRISNIQTDFS
ncbi:hypothetical protein J3455_14675 [Pseudoalteromonas sp. NFXS39]|uniref:hypothetical protein n=1 Tax=Pseudoalteromonas sp. NFXS39 TaxID=2818437 RepID=UPI0032DEE082